MSKKHDKDLAAILQAKADFLISLQANCGMSIGDRLAHLKEREEEIEKMPTRGHVQRWQKEQANLSLEHSMEKFQARLGRTVLSSYSFVEAHAGLLPAGMRKLLMGRGSK